MIIGEQPDDGLGDEEPGDEGRADGGLDGERLDDDQLAGRLAQQAGRELVTLRDRRLPTAQPWSLRGEGDLASHRLLVDALATFRPDDIVLSEEGVEDRRRLSAERTWIVDPLDGSYDFPYPDSAEWAVHVALVSDGRPTAAAVSVPGLGLTERTATAALADTGRRDRIVVSGRSNPYLAMEVAGELDADLVACGSAGVKAMLVVNGTVDVYIHASGLWEWDVCAPAAVAEAAGAVVTDLRGRRIVYNKPRPTVEGLIISRPELAEQVRKALDALR